MKKKRFHRMNLASSSSAYSRSSSRQKSAILRKFKLSSEISTGSTHTTLLPLQSGAVYEHIDEYYTCTPTHSFIFCPMAV